MASTLVSPQWVAEHIDDPNVRLVEIDRDGDVEYRAGHLPGALGFNWKSLLWDDLSREFPSGQEFAQRLGNMGVAGDTTIVLYGVPVQFGTYAWWVMRYCGHQDVRLLDGSKTLWRREGRTLTTEVPTTSPTTYEPGTRNEDMRIGRDCVLDAIKKGNRVILDHRSASEFSGQRVAPPEMPDVGAERHGRIPGARHVPYDKLLNSDDTFKPPEELGQILAAVGVNEETDIISYCRLSHRATLAYFAMTELLGFKRIRTYDGSWTEWGSIVGVPIER